MNSVLLVFSLLVCLASLPLNASDYPTAPIGVEFGMCAGADNIVCTDGSHPWDEGPLRCCPYTESSAFCCRKDNPMVCFVKQIARHVTYQPPNHLPCCYNCPMGTGEYYGVSDNAERGSIEVQGKAEENNKKAIVESAPSENVLQDEHPMRSDDLMRAENNATEIQPVTPLHAIAVDPPAPPPTVKDMTDLSDEDDESGVLEACKVKGLATYYANEDTVCCVGAASSQCCLKSRTGLCNTDAFGDIEPIKGLNREVLNAKDFQECTLRRPPVHMIAFLRPVHPQNHLIAASVRISQIEGCNSRVLMNVHTNHLPVGFDYAFHVGNSTACGDATDKTELMITLPVSSRHERFQVPSAMASVRDLRGQTLTVHRMEQNQPQVFACGRFL